MIYPMKSLLKFVAFALLCLLIPQDASPWAEVRHPIEEVLVQRLLLDENYVFCGTDASWGTNSFGLFVFDRRTETWRNYPSVKASPSPSSSVKSIERTGKYVDVQFRGGMIRFDLDAGTAHTDETKYFQGRSQTALAVHAGNKTYTFGPDSITISVIHAPGVQRTISLPGVSAPTHPVTEAPLKYYAFSEPIIYENKVFFAYNAEGPGDISLGLGCVALDDTIFHFYPSNIFKGRVTGAFIHNSSIIFSTAHFVYEGNAGPAAGFVQFSPADSSFQIWDELPLPDHPLAIFSLKQDTVEYWIGTDRGVFRIDKKTNKCIHYGITKGVIPRDGVNVYAGIGRDDGKTEYPVAAELNKGETVEVLFIYNAWCNIKAPKQITGYVSISHVISPHDQERPEIVQLQPRAVVKAEASEDANALVRFGAWRGSPESGYVVVGTAGRGGSVEWYRILIPTAWIYLNHMAFSFGEIE